MKRLILVAAAIGVLLWAPSAQGLNIYNIGSGSWTQTPPEGLPAWVEAEGDFGASSLFHLQAFQSQPATPSTNPDYQWQTEYDYGFVTIVLDGWEFPMMADWLMNYNNNDPETGLPTQFLFRGGGCTTDMTPYLFEAWWDVIEDPLNYDNYPVMIGADLTGGRLLIGDEIPEPTTIGLLLIGLGGLVLLRRHRKA